MLPPDRMGDSERVPGRMARRPRRRSSVSHPLLYLE